MRIIIHLLIIAVCISNPLFGQYIGGSYDGYDKHFFKVPDSSANFSVKGGSYDGYGILLYQTPYIASGFNMFGGSYSGYSIYLYQSPYLASNFNMFGGSYSGYSIYLYQTPKLASDFSVKGGNYDGYSSMEGVETKQLFAPILISPEQNSYVSIDEPLQLKWQRSIGALEYILVIATDIEFENIVYSDTTESLFSYFDNVQYETAYFWRVMAKNDLEESQWSSVRSFVGSGIFAPSLSLPINESYNISRTPQFEWQNLGLETKYKIQVSRDEGFNQIVYSQSGISTNYFTFPALDYNSIYYWRVMAYDDDYESSWSEVWSFTTEQAAYPNLTFSGNYINFGSVELGESEIQKLFLRNTGNVSVTINDYEINCNDFYLNDSFPFTLDVGDTIELSIYFEPETAGSQTCNLKFISDELNITAVSLSGIGYQISETPLLEFVDDDFYNGNTGVYPESTDLYQYVEYRIVYFNENNIPPLNGYPKVGIDLNGDGDFDDFGEEHYTMNESDPDDNNYIDGKEFSFLFNYESSGVYGYQFFAYDSLGNIAEGNGSIYKTGPTISSNELPDLAIYPKDISATTMTPAVYEEITIKAIIKNLTTAFVKNVNVKVYEDYTLIYNTTIPFINGNSEAEISFERTFTNDGLHRIRFFVDEANQIEEVDEYNNATTFPIMVGEYSIEGYIEAISALSAKRIQKDRKVRIFGRADYVNTLDPNSNVAGAEIEFQIVETGQIFKTHTKSTGNYSYYFPVPSEPGIYTICGRVTDYTLTADIPCQTFEVYDPICYLPDLAVRYLSGTDIVWETNCKRVGDSIFGTAYISNIGRNAAENVRVHIYQDNILIKVETISFIGAKQRISVEFTVSYSTPGWHSVTANIDPYQEIEECELWNNNGSIRQYIYPTGCDLSPTVLTMSNNRHWEDDAINFNFQIKNILCEQSCSTTARIYDIYEGTKLLIGTLSVSPLNSLSSTTISLTNYVPSGLGWHTVQIELDNCACDINADNNINNATFFVRKKNPDLAIRDYISTYIYWSSACKAVGDEIDVVADIKNYGNLPAPPSIAHVSIDGQTPTTYNIPEILAGSSYHLEFEVTYNTVGYHNVSVTLDPENRIDELREWNNYGIVSRYIYPLEPELAFKHCGPFVWDIWFSDNSPCPGESVDINVKVTNLNCAASSNPSQTTTVKVYDIYQSQENLLGSLTLNPLSSMQSQTMVLENVVFQQSKTGLHEIKALIEYNDEIVTCSRGIFVDMPDLIVSKIKAEYVPPEIEPNDDEYLVQTAWDQRIEPFVNLSPDIGGGYKAPAGCVAIAMAQIMNYWQWPEMLNFSIDYWDIYPLLLGNLKYEFDAILDYDNLTDNHKSLLTGACGYSVNTNYEEDISTALSLNIPNSMRKFFNYVANDILIKDLNYNDEEWQQIIINELDNGRPIIYTATAFNFKYPPFSTHAWIIDGFREVNGKYEFHNNWGFGYGTWNTFDDFTVSIVGTTYTFNLVHQMITSIYPKRENNFEATIKNRGNCDAENFEVIYTLDGEQFGDIITIHRLEAGADTLISSDTWTIPQPTVGLCPELCVIVDESNVVAELNENNNELCKLAAIDFTVNTGYYHLLRQVKGFVGKPVFLKARISNQGLFDTYSVPISFICDNELLGESFVDVIGESSVGSQISYIFDTPGNYVVAVRADTIFEVGSYYPECNEDNNVDYIYVTIIDYLPDLEVLSKDIHFDPDNPEINEETKITTTFRNIGLGKTESFQVSFMANSIPLSAPITISGLEPGEEISLTSPKTYSYPFGGFTHVIRTLLDIENNVKEVDELNNEASRAIIVGAAPNLAFSSSGITLSNYHPQIEDSIDIRMNIINKGGAKGQGKLLIQFVSDLDTSFIDDIKLPTMNEGDSLELDIKWQVIRGYGLITALIYDCQPYEYKTFDNFAELYFDNRYTLPLSVTVNADTNRIWKGKSIQLSSEVTGGTEDYLYSWYSQPYGWTSFIPHPEVYPETSGIYSLVINDGISSVENNINIEVLELFLINPENYLDFVPTQTNFKWQSLEGADNYRIQISKSVTFDSTEFDTLTNNSDTTFTARYLEYNTEYFWRVRANNLNDTSAWSNIWNFKTREFDTINIYLLTGWNLISSYIVPEMAALEDIYSDIEQSTIIVKNNSGQIYYPVFDINDIGDWDVKQGYQVYMSQAETLSITGIKIVPEATEISLAEGWNMIAYLRDNAMDIEIALAALVADEKLVIAKDNMGNVFYPAFEINMIGNMLPGQGYQIYLLSGGTLVYPEN